MNLDTIFVTLEISSLTIGLTLLAIYSAFGPESKNLTDPFEQEDN